jgi:hypothetical protein
MTKTYGATDTTLARPNEQSHMTANCDVAKGLIDPLAAVSPRNTIVAVASTVARPTMNQFTGVARDEQPQSNPGRNRASAIR